jgi:cytochrome c biogenesis protein CcdA
MAGTVLNPALGYLAGVLTILSPCVLPLVPIVLGSAAQQHRFGPIALAFGLITGFTTIGFALAAFGSTLGINSEDLRLSGAIILAAAGAFLVLPRLQAAVATAAGPLMAWAGVRQQLFDGRGLWGQFAIGLLLGLVWSPCVGPTLGAAVALAAQGEKLSQVAVTMAAFATGISTVLLGIAFVGRQLFNRIRGNLSASAKSAKIALGILLLAVGLSIVTGFDRAIEAWFVTAAPDWLIRATTMF